MNPIGFSTGALALGDFRLALEYLRGKPLTAVELSALRVSELPLLLKAVPSLDLNQFNYIALHAPSSFSATEEPEIVRLLTRFPDDWKIVLHPDAVHDSVQWLPFGHRLALENMDRRKLDGRSVEEMSRWFSLMPEAQFCLDLAHAQQWDTTMTEAYLFLRSFSNRICQIHISQLDSASHHYPLSEGSIRAFSEVAWLIPEDVPFIIESRVSSSEMDGEIAKVRKIASSAARDAYQAIPA
jgi:hypothetical protein